MLTFSVATERDLSLMMDLEKIGYPRDMQADKVKFAQRIAAFPEGNFIVYINEENGKVPIAYTTNQLINYLPGDEVKGWIQSTDGGHCTATHQTNGNALYLVSAALDPAYRGRGIGKEIYRKRVELAQKIGKKFVVGNSRIPTIRKNIRIKLGISPEEFLNLTDREEIQKIVLQYIDLIYKEEVQDPLAIMIKKLGFDVAKINPYYMEDYDSLHVGVFVIKEL